MKQQTKSCEFQQTPKADTPLLVNPHAMLAFAIALQGLQPV